MSTIRPGKLRLKRCPVVEPHTRHDWVWGNFKYLCRGWKKKEN